MYPYQPLRGSSRALMPNSRPAGPVDQSDVATLTVRVRSRGNVADLENMVHEQSTKRLGDRIYLTRAELVDRFGARPEDLDAVEAVAQEHDLIVTRRDRARRAVTLRGRLKNLLEAFPADVRIYHHASGPYRGRRGEIKMPQHLDGIVTGIFGYDTRPRHRSPHRLVGRASAAASRSNGVVATEFARRYKFPTEFQGTELDGSGQTIAVVELGGGFRKSDLSVFCKEAGLPVPSVTSVSVDGASNDPTTAASDDGEVMLDLEVACAVAPGARLVVYFAPNNGDQGFIHAFGAAIHDSERRPDVISVSWGGPEHSSDQQGLAAFHELFAEAAALGITICAASGDHGTADDTIDRWDGKIHVDHPACDDLILGCGGTQIENGVDVAWNDGTNLADGGWASGGGISTIFDVPPYQAGSSLPISLDTGKGGRGVPDISMSATNYLTRVDGMEGMSGGTSAVAPLMAGLVARLNQAKKKNVGFLNPFLYANAGKGAVDDVSIGSNAIAGSVQGYSAAIGWDACTGLGTPNGEAILRNL